MIMLCCHLHHLQHCVRQHWRGQSPVTCSRALFSIILPLFTSLLVKQMGIWQGSCTGSKDLRMSHSHMAGLWTTAELLCPDVSTCSDPGNKVSGIFSFFLCPQKTLSFTFSLLSLILFKDPTIYLP